MPGGIHHTAVIVRDLDASLRFYRDGLGLDLLADRRVEGDWPGLFGAATRQLRAVFLGDSRVPDDQAGVLELNVLDGAEPGPPPSAPQTGFFMMSFFVDVEATLSRLAELGLGGTPRHITQPTPNGPLPIATVRDPDGVLVLLTPARSPAVPNAAASPHQSRVTQPRAIDVTSLIYLAKRCHIDCIQERRVR